MKKLIILLTLISVTSCGAYNFYTRSNPELHSIMISKFQNDSEEYELPTLIDQYLISEIIDDDRLEVKGDNADIDVTGVVRSYKREVYAYDEEENPLQWQISFVFSIKVQDVVQNEVIWQNTNLRMQKIYNESEAENTGEGVELYSEEEARIKIIQDLAEQILTNTLEQW